MANRGAFVHENNFADLWRGAVVLDAGSGTGGSNLTLDLGLDFGKGDRSEIVVVHAHIVLQREKHPQARVVQTSMRCRTAVDVAEELPDVSVRTAVTEERIVVQDDRLTTHFDGHLLGNVFELTHIALAERLHVVVPKDKVFASGKGMKDIVPKSRAPMGEVTQVEHDAILRHGLPPATDKFSVHLFGIADRPSAVADDVLVTKVGVGGEIYLLGFEFVDLFGHSRKFCCFTQ